MHVTFIASFILSSIFINNTYFASKTTKVLIILKSTQYQTLKLFLLKNQTLKLSAQSQDEEK